MPASGKQLNQHHKWLQWFIIFYLSLRMKPFCISIFLMAYMATAMAMEPFTVNLYPNGAPDSNGITEAEYEKDGRFYNTTHARMDLYLPDGGNSRMMILTCPGGGYRYTSTYNEGVDVAKFFNARGIAVAVLKYRMPNGHANIPLEDALTAITIIRDSAACWRINPNQVGVIGFSAGGHLASMVVTKFTSHYNRPDFGILVYPVISMDTAVTHLGSRTKLLGEHPAKETVGEWSADKKVSEQTPPCYVVANADDRTVPVKNSLLFYESLVQKGVSAELHIFPVGGHGWGFTRQFNGKEQFESSLMTWLTAGRR